MVPQSTGKGVTDVPHFPALGRTFGPCSLSLISSDLSYNPSASLW
jgi:hypothetical protein